MNFSELQVGELFYFVSKPPEEQPPDERNPYTKIEEIRRPYTPEAYSNALRADGVFFYVVPTQKVVVHHV